MGASTDPVKQPRRYDASGRRHRAEQTRQTVLDTARQLFLRHGYAATTIASIATAAGVSSETIYKSFGTKEALLRTIRTQALAGAGPVPAEERADAAALNESDPRRIIATWAQLTTEVAPRVAPILVLIRDAAAADPDLAPLAQEMDAARLERMADNARALYDHGHLRTGLTVERARDICYAYTMPELYLTLVTQRGWTITDYADFIETALAAALLP